LKPRANPIHSVGHPGETHERPPAIAPIERDGRFALFRDWYFEAKPAKNDAGGISRLVGASPPILDLRRQIERYAPTEETVLISGETGTGKELVAELLHRLSPRREGPFVAVNCAAIPEALAESEFFGTTRGAYTGAVQDRAGLFAHASGGTLFLDEFGELANDIQSKLLRSLDLGVYRRVGASCEEHANVRIIAATNLDLEQRVQQGRFRADLYYRIAVLRILSPPLRERSRDIPQLVGEFFGELLPRGGRARVTAAAMQQLLEAPWPGNVRELRNTLRRALVLANDGVIDQFRLDSTIRETRLGADHLRENGADALVDVLNRHKGRLGPVAGELGVSVRTVQRRMKESGLRLRDFRMI
jgi:transcriptional regulator with PAS, ATPase and Fis domain